MMSKIISKKEIGRVRFCLETSKDGLEVGACTHCVEHITILVVLTINVIPVCFIF